MIEVALITTGGTIDKTYGTGKGVRDLCIGPSRTLDFLRRVVPNESVIVCRIAEMRKDSLDITDIDRAWIAHECYLAGEEKILITHGTDTMIETAQVIYESGAAKNHTIVLTGALRPATMRDSDAEFNLGLALGACLCKPYGVYIALSTIYAWDRCYKDPQTGIFRPLPFGI